MATKKKVSSKSSRSKKRLKEAHKEDTCFIIMPFGDWFDTYYDSIYLPAIEEIGLIPRRADNLYRPSAIINDIWALTNEAKVILADLSEKNPNVFYELGMAHALAKPAVLVTESMDDVPFDLRALRIIVYEKNRPDWGDVLKKNIQTAIHEVLVSPLDSVLPTFIKVKETSAQPSVSKVEKELISLRQEIDMVRRDFQYRDAPLPRAIQNADFVKWIRFATSMLSRGISEARVAFEVRHLFNLTPEEATMVVRRARLTTPGSESSGSPSDTNEVDVDTDV